jgi:hypothetical protein
MLDRWALSLSGDFPEQVAQMNAQAFSLTAQGDAEWVTDDVRSLLSRPSCSFEEFAADYATAFS